MPVSFYTCLTIRRQKQNIIEYCLHVSFSFSIFFLLVIGPIHINVMYSYSTHRSLGSNLKFKLWSVYSQPPHLPQSWFSFSCLSVFYALYHFLGCFFFLYSDMPDPLKLVLDYEPIVLHGAVPPLLRDQVMLTIYYTQTRNGRETLCSQLSLIKSLSMKMKKQRNLHRKSIRELQKYIGITYMRLAFKGPLIATYRPSCEPGIQQSPAAVPEVLSTPLMFVGGEYWPKILSV